MTSSASSKVGFPCEKATTRPLTSSTWPTSAAISCVAEWAGPAAAPIAENSSAAATNSMTVEVFSPGSRCSGERSRILHLLRMKPTIARPGGAGAISNPLFVARVDDLNPAIVARERIGCIFQLTLAVAHRHQAAGLDTVFLQQETLDRIGAALGQALVIGVATLAVGVPGHDEGTALQVGARERLAARRDLRRRPRPDRVGVVFEVDFKIDARPLLGDRNDLVALSGGERTGGPVAQGVHEAGFLRPAGCVAGRCGKPPRDPRGLQRPDDIFRGRLLRGQANAEPCGQGETGSQHDASQIDLERPVMRRHVPLPVLLAPRLGVHASWRCDGRTSRTGM